MFTALHPSLQAANSTYTAGGTGVWSGSSNWTLAGGPGNVSGIPNAPGDYIQRLSGSTFTITQDVGAGVTIGGVAIGGTITNLLTVGSSANSITFNQDGPGGPGSAAIVNSATTAAGRITFSAPIILADDLRITNNNSAISSAASQGAIYFSTSAPISGAGNIIINNVVNDPILGGINFFSANTFSGTVFIESGVTGASTSNAFGNVAGNTLVLGKAGGGNATLNVTLGGAGSFANNIIVAAATGGTNLLSSTAAGASGGASFTGAITLNGDLSMSAPSLTTNARFSASGPISGAGAFTAVAGNIQLSGSNTFTGATRVNSGTLFLGGSGNTTYALQNSTLDLNSGDTGKVNFGVSTTTTVNAAVIGGLTGTGNLDLRNMNTAPGAVALSVGNNNTNQTYSGSLTGSGSFIKIGTGTQTLAGVSSYTGTTAVNLGTLLVDGAHTGGGAYSVGASGKFGGAGSITATSLTVGAGGKLTPGGDASANPALTLALSAGMNLSASSNDSGAYLFDLATETTSDKIRLTLGTLDIGTMTNADFVFSELAGFGNGTYILFDASSSILGSVTSAPDSIVFSGGRTGTLSLDSVNHDIILTVVPEPSSVLLLGFGLTVTLWRFRSKKARGSAC